MFDWLNELAKTVIEVGAICTYIRMTEQQTVDTPSITGRSHFDRMNLIRIDLKVANSAEEKYYHSITHTLQVVC